MGLFSKVMNATRLDGQRGLFALERIAPGEVLQTYNGPIIDHPTRYSIQIEVDQHIEGTEESNAFLNHSCSPNAYVDWGGPQLRARREIAPDEEITCNYLTTDWELHEAFTCRCGAERCYGRIRGLKYLSREGQEDLVPWIREFMERRVRSCP